MSLTQHCLKLGHLLLLLALTFAVKVEQVNSGEGTSIERQESLSERLLTERWAVIDGKVILPCDVTPPYPGDSPILVLISKGATPIYSVDARNGESFATAMKWSEPLVIGSRGKFVMINGGGLEIESVRKADQSDYHCRVEFHDSPTRNSRVRLHLIVAPSKPVVLDGAGKEVEGVIGPYSLGDTITLSCRVKGGYPKPRVTWWHELFLLDDISEVTDDDATVNKIILPDLTRQHLNRKLTCQATNNNITKAIETSVILDMSFPPASVDITGSDGPLSVGKKYTFTCETTHSRPPASIRWSKDDSLINSSVRDMVVGGQTHSTLIFTPTKDDNGKALVCRGWNEKLPNKVKEDARILDIRYPPILNLSLGSNLDNNNIKEGDDVYFECDVSGNPEVTSVEWYHNGTEMQHNKTLGIILSFKNLVLQQVKRENSGTYTCGASNSQGTARSSVFTLNVHYSPVCSTEQQGVYGSGRKEIVNITCSVESYPLPKSFHWALNTSSTDLLDVPRSHTHNNELTSILTYTPHSPLDYGSLLCWAENSVGKQRQPCVFQVVPAALPEPVHNCSAWHNNSAPGQVVVRCWAGWNGGLEQTFSLEVKVGDTGELVASLNDQEKPRFTVTGLKPGQEYILDISASNSQGSAPSITITHLTPIDIAEKRLSKNPGEIGGVGVPTYVGVLVGVLSVLLICCITACIMVKIRSSSRPPESSTNIREPQERNDGNCKQADGDPDVILVSPGLRDTSTKDSLLKDSVMTGIEDRKILPQDSLDRGMLPSSTSPLQLIETQVDTTGPNNCNQSKYHPAESSYSKTFTRASQLAYFPTVAMDHQYPYQGPRQFDGISESASLTLPAKKTYRRKQPSHDSQFTDVIGVDDFQSRSSTFNPSDMLGDTSLSYGHNNDKITLLATSRGPRHPPCNEKIEGAGYLSHSSSITSNLGLNSCNIRNSSSAQHKNSLPGDERKCLSPSNVNSPQRESVV